MKNRICSRAKDEPVHLDKKPAKKKTGDDENPKLLKLSRGEDPNQSKYVFQEPYCCKVDSLLLL